MMDKYGKDAANDRTGIHQSISLPATSSAPAAYTETERAIEAILISAIEPVRPGLLAELLEIPSVDVEQICDALSERYEQECRGFILARVAGGYRMQTHPDLAAYMERFAMERMSPRLSSAALETLAIVAYKQPISKAQVGAIRGVNVDGVIKLLSQRGYIEVSGYAEGPGRPVLYSTTSQFLEGLGLDGLDELPPVSDLVPSGESELSAIEDRFKDSDKSS
jgi:segregation and condensation protein B